MPAHPSMNPDLEDNYLEDGNDKAPILSGNAHSGEAAELDSYLRENTDGTKAKLPPEAKTPVVQPKTQPKEPTRLLGGTLTLAAGAQPVQILPADVNRTGFTLRCNSLAGVGSEQLRFSSDPTLMFSDQMCPSIVSSVGATLVPHTGPVYVYCPATMPNGSPSQGMTVYYYAVAGSKDSLTGNDY